MRPASVFKKASIAAAAALLLISCRGGDRTASTPREGPRAVTTRPSPADTGSADPAPGPVRGLTHGGRYWGVYIFVGGANDASYDRSIERLEAMGLERGHTFSDGELRCDSGAAEALGVAENEQSSARAVAVYFEDEQDARAFADSLEEPPVGVVRVRTLCAD